MLHAVLMCVCMCSECVSVLAHVHVCVRVHVHVRVRVRVRVRVQVLYFQGQPDYVEYLGHVHRRNAMHRKLRNSGSATAA